MCSGFYDSNDIAKSKKLLFDIVNPNIRHRKHRGENKNINNVRDMLDIFLSHGEKDLPVFVAQDLSKLPPLGINDFDVLHVNREIQGLKSNLQEMHNQQEVNVTEEIGNIKNSIMDLAQSQKQLFKLLEGKQNHSTPIQTKAHSRCIQNMSTSHLHSTPGSQNMGESYIIVDVTDCESNDDSLLSIHSDSDVEMDITEERNTPSDRLHTDEEMDESDGSWIEQRREKRKSQGIPRCERVPDIHQNLTGTGTFQNIKGANTKPSKQRRPIMPRKNQVVSGLFVSRMSPSTTVRQMTLHIRRETGYSICPERLPAKHDTYSSWYIRTNNQCMQDLYNAALWPKNSLIKPYFT